MRYWTACTYKQRRIGDSIVSISLLIDFFSILQRLAMRLSFLPKPLEPRRFAKEFASIAKKAGVNVHRHGLRHSVASVLIDNGVSAADVAALLGHADEAFTYKQYVHPRKDATKKATSAMKAALNPKPKLTFKKLIRVKKEQAE
ncbi:tyrosine-type recombinase/integrase [Sporomusa sp. GT1]|uniref:tyrosine-type recombinase/integrase n=1 Tax=Sporomusa sp. GT1 TaxID=1534747 RepID=UPI001CB8809F|nr:tyrosine-type recombinase/integrase [Sporomusa sp. GT1]